MQKISTTAVAIALVTGLSAPAAAQNKEHQQMAAELRMLQQQQQELALGIAQIAEAIKGLSSKLDASDQKLVKGLADHKLVIDGLSRDLSVIRESSQDTGSRIRMIAEELEALRTSLPSMLSQAAPPPAPSIDPADPNAPPPATPPVSVAPPPLSTAGLSPNRMLDTAKADYFAGQFALAITGFEQFLKAFPRSDSAGEAQFYIGESYSSLNRWADAVNAYNLAIQNYPMSRYVSDMYYKRGLAQERLGQLDAARASWDTVLKTYPNSEMATLAKQRLDRLTRDSASQRPPG